jgi:hypothetical protein
MKKGKITLQKIEIPLEEGMPVIYIGPHSTKPYKEYEITKIYQKSSFVNIKIINEDSTIYGSHSICNVLPSELRHVVIEHKAEKSGDNVWTNQIPIERDFRKLALAHLGEETGFYESFGIEKYQSSGSPLKDTEKSIMWAKLVVPPEWNK